MKFLFKLVLISALLCVVAQATEEEKKPVKAASFETENSKINVFVEGGDLSALGPEPAAAAGYSGASSSVSMPKKLKKTKKSKKGKKGKKGKSKKKSKRSKNKIDDSEPIGGYMMDIKMVDESPKDKMFTVPRSALQEPGTLGLNNAPAPKDDGDKCTDNCRAKKFRKSSVTGPTSYTGVLGNLKSDMIKVPNTETEAAPPSQLVWPTGESTQLATPTTTFVASAPPLAPLQSCGCSSCPCATAIQPHSPCGCEECPCPAIHQPPPVCGCSVCPCPQPSCGCAVCPCPAALPFPNLLSPAQTQAILRVLGVNTAPTLPTNCATPGCPQYMSPGEKAARDKEMKEEQHRKELAQERHKLHEEMFKHQANFNAISRLSRQLRFEYSQLQRTHSDLKARIEANRRTLVNLKTLPKDMYDIDGPSNGTEVKSVLENKNSAQKRLMNRAQAKQATDICAFMGLDKSACASRSKALSQVSSIAKGKAFIEESPIMYNHEDSDSN